MDNKENNVSFVSEVVDSFFETNASNGLVHTIQFSQTLDEAQVKHIKTLLHDLKSVESVKVDTKKSTAYVASDEPGDILASVLNRAGFKVASVQ